MPRWRFPGSDPSNGPGNGGLVPRNKEMLQKYFGQGFRLAALRPRPDIDNIPKADLFTGMQMATRDCVKKGEYSKGQHSFEILAQIDPAKVRASSPAHAGRLFSVLDRKCAP